jgi:hypothetical protein
VSPRDAGRPPAPVPPKRDDAGNPQPEPRPGETPEAGTWGGEGGAGEYRGGPVTSDVPGKTRRPR